MHTTRSKFRFPSILILAFAASFCLGGCGNGGESNNPSGTMGTSSSPSIPTAGAQGFLFRSNSVVMVADPGKAPVGSTPLQGAMVLAWDVNENLVGLALTGPTGFFNINGTPGGLIRLEVKADPNGATDLTQSMTMVPGGTVTPNQSYPVGRDQAINIARSRFTEDALVTASLNPLPAGTTVVPADGSLAARVSPSDEWFLMVNPQPFSMYSHPVEYLFVNSNTGQLTSVPAEYYPLVNGEPMWDAIKDSFNYGVVFPPPANVPPIVLPEVVSFPSVLARFEASPRQEADPPRPLTVGNNTNVWGVAIAGGDDWPPLVDANRVADSLVKQGVPTGNVLRVYAGNRNKEWTTPELRLALLLEDLEVMRRKMKEQVEPVTVLWYFNGNGGSQGVEFGGIFWNSQSLLGGALKAGAEDVWAIFEGSGLGGLVPGLIAQANTAGSKSKITVVTSTDASTRAGLAWMPKQRLARDPIMPGFATAPIADGGFFTTGLLDQWTIENNVIKGVIDSSKLLSPLSDINQVSSLFPVVLAGLPQKPQAAVFTPPTVVRNIVTLGDGDPKVRQVKVRVSNFTQDEFGLTLGVDFNKTNNFTLKPMPLPPRGSAASSSIEESLVVPVKFNLSNLKVKGIAITVVPFVAEPRGRSVMQFNWREDGKGGRTMQIRPETFDPTQPFVEDNPIELGDGESIL